MSEPVDSEPPARPSTSWVSAPPLVKQRDQQAARSLVVSCWLWLGAALTATITAAVSLLEYDRMYAVIHEVAQQQDAAAEASTLDSVAMFGVVVLVGGGVAFALLQLILAAAMRNGRNWARGVLVVFAFVGVGYALLLIVTVTTEVLGDLVAPIRGGLGGYIALVLAATVAMFSRRAPDRR